jgi:hypothetical protein
MDFLGNVLSSDGVRPNPKKFESIKEWQSQVLVKGVKLFLGLTNFYKKFIIFFYTLAKPLTNLLKKEGSFKWEDEQQNAFNLSKESCCQH